MLYNRSTLDEKCIVKLHVCKLLLLMLHEINAVTIKEVFGSV